MDDIGLELPPKTTGNSAVSGSGGAESGALAARRDVQALVEVTKHNVAGSPIDERIATDSTATATAAPATPREAPRTPLEALIDLLAADAELRRLVTLWPRLRPEVRTGILSALDLAGE